MNQLIEPNSAIPILGRIKVFSLSNLPGEREPHVLFEHLIVRLVI